MGRGKFLSGFFASYQKGSCFQPCEVLFFFPQDLDLLLIFLSFVRRTQLGFLFV